MDSQPLYEEVLKSPCTTITIAICVSVWLILTNKNLDYEHVGLSYKKFWKDKEYWRGITASFSHINILHLLFNMSSLWSIRVVEYQLGSIFYLKYSLLMLLASIAIIILAYHLLIYKFNKEEYMNNVAVGYSCVVFGWMTILSQFSQATMLNIFGMQIPLSLAPFGSLILTSVLIRNASFIGHLSGIIIGYFIAFTEYYGFVFFTDYVFYCTAFWTIVAFIVSLKYTKAIEVRYLEIEEETRSNSNGAVLQNGILVRNSATEEIV